MRLTLTCRVSDAAFTFFFRGSHSANGRGGAGAVTDGGHASPQRRRRVAHRHIHGRIRLAQGTVLCGKPCLLCGKRAVCVGSGNC